MTFTFVSNYINHHQKPFCDAMYAVLGEEFSFVATMPMEDERVAMGWDTSLTKLPYVKLLYENPEVVQLIMNSDVVLFGWSEREDIASRRLLSGKVTLRVSERLYRDGRYKAISPRGLVAKYHEHIKFRKQPVYMLCAGAYTADDFALIHAYPDKKLKWGYFPPMRDYEDGELQAKKDMSDGIQIVWAGRFIPLKHPEFVIKLARHLKAAGAKFHIHLIGSGELEDEIRKQVADGLEEYITLYGFMSPDEVRDVMERSHIHLCTSNQLEGWGAVVNEGMNSGCVEIVSDRMGAVPFLIEDGVNGLTYSKDSYEELEHQVDLVVGNWDEYSVLGTRAWETIRTEWNAEVAAQRLLTLCENLLAGKDESEIITEKSGPLSKAPNLKLH